VLTAQSLNAIGVIGYAPNNDALVQMNCETDAECNNNLVCAFVHCAIVLCALIIGVRSTARCSGSLCARTTAQRSSRCCCRSESDRARDHSLVRAVFGCVCAGDRIVS
jgi:hypothetical protein